MKRCFNKKAFTIVEVVVSIAIFAAIALPLFSVFVQSIKTDRKAYDVLNANYISQGYIEKLDAMTYAQALSAKPTLEEYEGYYLSASIKPHGASGALFDEPCGFAHIIMNADGGMLAVMPDGKWHEFASVPSSISLQITSGWYSFTGGYTTLTGELDYGYCAMLINAMNKSAATTSSVTLGAGCKALYYCPTLHEDDISFSGSYETYANMINPLESLIHVSAAVYASASDEEAVATSEGYISINNRADN